MAPGANIGIDARRSGSTITAGMPPPEATWAMPAVNRGAEQRTIKGSSDPHPCVTFP